MPDARITLRRKSPYCTKSNKFKKVRTPGGKLHIQYTKKLPSVPKCGDTGASLFGVAVARPKELARKSKRMKTVSRCYGGVLCGSAVRNRYVLCNSYHRDAREDPRYSDSLDLGLCPMSNVPHCPCSLMHFAPIRAREPN